MIYKILPSTEWAAAVKKGIYEGSADDQHDGFIHFSAGPQLEDTAHKYFSGKQGLLLVAFDETALGPALLWEKSRGGDLFPHLYSSLDTSLALWSRELSLRADGTPQLPAEEL